MPYEDQNKGSVQIHADTFGFPENDPVLLIAGAMAQKHCFHVICFDNRDMSWSTHFPQSPLEAESNSLTP